MKNIIRVNSTNNSKWYQCIKQETVMLSSYINIASSIIQHSIINNVK